MAPHVSETQGLSAEHYSKSGEMLGVSKDSHGLGKLAGGGPLRPPMHAPTIRVIHIFAPKVIKTDVANFRSTVQKLTGRKKSPSASQRRARTKTVPLGGIAGNNPSTTGLTSCDGSGSFSGLWDQESSQKEVLQRLVGDAIGPDLVRCNSMESSYSSMDSGHFSGDSNGSNEADLQSPSGSSFSFYPHRESPYSLNEIPAPFFAGEIPCDIMASRTLFSHAGSGTGIRDSALPLPSVTDNMMSGVLGFSDMDISSGLGIPLPEFPSIPPLGTSTGLYEMFMQPTQLCRLSVQSPFQGTNFFESI